MTAPDDKKITPAMITGTVYMPRIEYRLGKKPDEVESWAVCRDGTEYQIGTITGLTLAEAVAWSK